MTKTEFLLTMSIQYEAEKWWGYMKTSSSPNSHHKNCLADSKENFWRDLTSENVDQILNLLLVCPTDEVYVRKESERCLERRKQEQENTNKQQSVEP